MRRLEQDWSSVLGDVRGKRVLDIGAGRGEHCFPLIEAGAIVVGIDISERYVADAVVEAARRGYKRDHYDFQVMDAHKMGFQEKSFDLVTGRGVLHHLDLHAALTEIRRILAPEGRAVFLEPLAANPLLRLYRLGTPSARTTDERPLTARDLKVIEGDWHSNSTFYGLVTAPVAVLTSIILRPCPENVLLRAADWIERSLNRSKALHPYNQYVLLDLRCSHRT
jgi:SAM-dependent methyltransferase